MKDKKLEESLDAYYAAEKQLKEVFLKAKEDFKENGQYKGDFSELEEDLFDDFIYAQHIGYVSVEILTGIKNTVRRYSVTERFFKVSDASAKQITDLQKLIFCEQTVDVDEDEYSTYLVCQWRNFEDDYKGYILLPMKDGRYWCFYYEM